MEQTAGDPRYIFGLKLRRHRREKQLGLSELAERSGLSISYLSEIEKGKKYPKPEKILEIAAALGVSFDELVSLQVDGRLEAIKTLFGSPLLQEFPFHLFGIEPKDVLDLFTEVPDKAGALVQALLEVARSYDVRVEHFLFAALRSYQQMHRNYFADLEAAAQRFRSEHGWAERPSVGLEELREVFTRDYGFTIDEELLETRPRLRGFRSVWVGPKPRKLLINPRLLPAQKAFVLGRELGYSYLGLGERAKTSSWLKVESFDQVLNNFKASYFAGALCVNGRQLRRDLESFFRRRSWDAEVFAQLQQRYQATPEMFFYRLTQLVPEHFGLPDLFFLRLNNKVGEQRVVLTKILNLSSAPGPHGIDLAEHYCRRWPGVQLLRRLAAQTDPPPGSTLVSAQRSHFIVDQREFFVFSMARPLVLQTGTSSERQRRFSRRRCGSA
ncbi:MAG: helix-turn-helix domain-containing protein [Thermoanaerobaculia bacterium]|nr:helix-turn-helix domain-containing protein [Thermoanaerobaculia bacterium]